MRAVASLPTKISFKDLSVEEAAAAIVALINSRARTPTPAGNRARPQGGHAPADPASEEDINLADLTFEPVRGSDGQPISFHYTDREFIKDLLPTVRLAFVTVTKTKAELTQIGRELLEDDVQDVLDALDAYDEVGNKFRSIADICHSAFARTAVIAEPLEDERIAASCKEARP